MLSTPHFGRIGGRAGAAPEGAPLVPQGRNATYGSALNLQADYIACTTDFSAIFSPLELAGRTMKNRIVKSCAASEM